MTQMMTQTRTHSTARKFTDRQLAAELRRGTSQADISRKFGVTHGAVSQRVRKIRNKGVSLSAGNGRPRKFSDEQLHELVEMQGLSKRAAAKRLGVTDGAVYLRMATPGYKWFAESRKGDNNAPAKPEKPKRAPAEVRVIPDREPRKVTQEPYQRELAVAGIVIQAMRDLTPWQRDRVLAYATHWSDDPANNPEEDAAHGPGAVATD